MNASWAVDDPCIVRGERGVVESVGPDCASVKLEGSTRTIFASLDELAAPAATPVATVHAWQVGDRCLARGEHEGVIDSIAGASASVKVNEWRRIRCDLDELEPLATPERTIAAPAADAYASFVDGKLTRVPPTGMRTVPPLHASLFPFQQDLVGWALRRGRSALFADTGLGKTRQELEWARCVAEYTKGRVLLLAPLAVGAQTVAEAERIGIAAQQVRYGADVEASDARIVVTNYDRIHHFDPAAFAGVVCDESSVIKNSSSKTFATLTEMFANTPFRLCATATPSPNDYTELGTHAEFLGICTREEMLAEFFCHDGGETQTWRLKGHARGAFWKWVAGWAALIRKPSDFGYSDEGYNLPELVITQHTIPVDHTLATENEVGQALLFAEPAKTLTDRRKARKTSLLPRVQSLVDVVNAEPNEPWIIWCELNAEADALAEALTGAVEIRGSDDAILKESRLVAFSKGEFRILISKPSICGWGLNWQHAARMAFVGVKDSYESTYQAIRRSWRFGQKRPVHVHVFASELEGEVVKNLERKEREALAMAEALSVETREMVRAEIHGQKRQTNDYAAAKALTRPSWLQKESAA